MGVSDAVRSKYCCCKPATERGRDLGEVGYWILILDILVGTEQCARHVRLIETSKIAMVGKA